MTPEEIAQLQAENDRLKTENSIYKEEVRQARNAENADFLESLIEQGKLAPVAKAKAESLLNYASSYDNGEILDFSEGESLSQQVKDFLMAQPQIITFGEVATKARAISEEPQIVQYAENVDPTKIELDQKIRSYMAQNNTNYTDAFLAITQGENL